MQRSDRHPLLMSVMTDFLCWSKENRISKGLTNNLTRRVVYVADSAVLDGPYATVGVHSYCCHELELGKYTMSFGNYIQRGIPRTEIWNMDPAIPQLDEEMWQKAEMVYPMLNRLDYELKFVGRIGIALT